MVFRYYDHEAIRQETGASDSRISGCSGSRGGHRGRRRRNGRNAEGRTGHRRGRAYRTGHRARARRKTAGPSPCITGRPTRPPPARRRRDRETGRAAGRWRCSADFTERGARWRPWWRMPPRRSGLWAASSTTPPVFERDDMGSAEPRELGAPHGREPTRPLRAHPGVRRRSARRRTPAAIVNLIDQRVWSLTPHFVSYTLSKAGLWTLTRTSALALSPAHPG